MNQQLHRIYAKVQNHYYGAGILVIGSQKMLGRIVLQTWESHDPRNGQMKKNANL